MGLIDKPDATKLSPPHPEDSTLTVLIFKCFSEEHAKKFRDGAGTSFAICGDNLCLWSPGEARAIHIINISAIESYLAKTNPQEQQQ